MSTPRPMMSLPAARISAARAVIASVGDALKALTRSESDMLIVPVGNEVIK